MVDRAMTHVVTGMIRMSYVNVFTPRAREGQPEPRYGMTVLLPKQDTATMARIQAAINAAREQGAQTCWAGVRIDAQPPIYDGDGVRPKDRTPFSPECRGHWVINCNCKRKPEVVDVNGNPIMDETQVYSGCYGRVSLDFFPYANTGGKGIGCGLGNVQKLQDGEPLGGGVTAAQDFGATGDVPLTTPAPTPAPTGAISAPSMPTTGYVSINPITGLPM